MSTVDSPWRSMRTSCSGAPRVMSRVALARLPSPSTVTRSSRLTAVVVLT